MTTGRFRQVFFFQNLTTKTVNIMLAAGEIRSTILEVVQVKKIVTEVTTRLDFPALSGK